MAKPSWSIMPSTGLGKWSVGLIVAMPFIFTLGTSFASSLYAFIPAGGTILADIAARPALAITMLVGIAAGIAAFVTGLLALIRAKERALTVYVSTGVGAILLAFLVGEFLLPG